MNEPLRSLVAVTDAGWLVGGAVRDQLLGRPTTDYDVSTEGAPAPVARAVARAAEGHAFKLSEGFGAWRVVARERTWQLDLLPVTGGTIERDLGQRDLTINAIAQRLGSGEYVDPFGGVADLQARRLRMVYPRAFVEDPLRTMRVARLHSELAFEVEAQTLEAARTSAPALRQVAPERVFAELKRIMASDRVLEGLRMMDELRATEAVLPELAALRGVEQSHFHHLDVHDHTLAVLAETIELERDPGQWLGEHGEAVQRLLGEPLANELTRGQALRFGALFHDIAKPRTRGVSAEGRVTFIGHDSDGAHLTRAILSRLRVSERLIEYVAALTLNHLRLGFLVHEMPLSRRAIYRYLRACEPVQVDVTLLSVADRLATRGRGSDVAIARHLELARQLVGEALAWRERRPRPPLRGDQLARAVGLRPGPDLGWLLEELEEAEFAGEIHSRDEAVARARELLSGPRAGNR